MTSEVLRHDLVGSHFLGAKPMCFMNKKWKGWEEEDIWDPTLSFKDMPPNDLKTFQNYTTS